MTTTPIDPAQPFPEPQIIPSGDPAVIPTPEPDPEPAPL